MKKRNLLFLLAFALLFFIGCEQEEGPLSSDVSIQDHNVIEKKLQGVVTTKLSLPAGNSVEGIVSDGRGNIYISNRRNEGGVRVAEILKLDRRGSGYTLFATLPPGPTNAYGILGLAADWHGDLYAAYTSGDPATHGVWKISNNGKTQTRLPNSEAIEAPNALIFGKRGNLYVTDCEGASVWCCPRNGSFEVLITDPLLAGGIAPGGPPFPLPGANGIAFYPPNKLYVANTLQNSISCITIGKHGNPSTIALVKQDFLLFGIDGIIVDSQENIYGVLPGCTLGAIGVPPVPPLVKLNPNTGVLEAVVTDPTLFDTPTSLCFGRGDRTSGSIFIANAALQYGQPPNAGPGVVHVR